MYHYKAHILSVHDGDTCTSLVELGFTVSVEVTFRLLKINAPELRGGTSASKAQAVLSRDFLRSMILGKTVYIQSVKNVESDAFGRWLCEIWLDPLSNESVNQVMLSTGHAVEFK